MGGGGEDGGSAGTDIILGRVNSGLYLTTSPLLSVMISSSVSRLLTVCS